MSEVGLPARRHDGGRWQAIGRAVLDADWLTQDRARAYGNIAAACCLLLAAGLAAMFVEGARHSASGLSYSCDFNAFWSAARLAVLGHPGAAWVPDTLRAMQAQNAQPISGGGYIAYPYPPVFQLLTLPLGALPFRYALPLFLAGGIAVFWLCLRRVLPRGWPALSIVLAPAAVVDAASTQNGWISAALFSAAMAVAGRRPALAGALLGGLCFKPQLALCVPLGLIAARRWRMLAAFAASVAVLCLTSWAVLGSEAWLGFFRFLPVSGALQQTRPIWGTGQSLYAALRILGAGGPGALAVQALFSAVALLAMLLACRRRPGGQAEIAVIAAASLAVTPYLLDYDLMTLLPPLAFVAAAACRGGWRSGEKPVLALGYLYPLLARDLSLWHVPLGPPVLALCLLITTHRAAQR